MKRSTEAASVAAHLRMLAQRVDNAAIDRLRAIPDPQNLYPTLDQVCEIVDALRTVVVTGPSNREIIERRTGMSTNQVVEAVVALGGFLVRSRGDHGVVFVDDVALMPMFNVPSTAWGTGKNRNKEVPPPPQRPTICGVEGLAANEALRPSGFGVTEVGRDVERSVRSIVAWSPTRGELARFVARTFAPKAAPLSFELVSSVWMFDNLGRLDDIDDVSPVSFEFQRNCVKAYDLLEFARRDALSAIADLIEGHVDSVRVNKSSLLFEADLSRLVRYVEAGRMELVVRECRFVAELASAGRFELTRIGELNNGQVLRICSAAGVDVTAVTRSEETAIREQLHRLGLGEDTDQLVRLGVAASRHGNMDIFWDACRRRLDGDPAWAEILNEMAV